MSMRGGGGDAGKEKSRAPDQRSLHAGLVFNSFLELPRREIRGSDEVSLW